MDLGADICCDSAHKTLPVLTGGAYLHLSAELDEAVGAQAKNAMMLFGSTSPSYLILQSLDRVNPQLADYPGKLEALIPNIDALKARLMDAGYGLYGSEPLKLTIEAKSRGCTGEELADLLREAGIEPEFADPDYLVLMFSTETHGETVEILERAFLTIPPKAPIPDSAPVLVKPERAMSIREAMLAPSEILPVGECLGRILAVPTVGCPPAVPILVCGERIDEHALNCFSYYGIEKCCVVKE